MLYQTVERVFRPISKSWLKNSAVPQFSNPRVGVWKSDETLVPMRDKLLEARLTWTSRYQLEL